jgi:hypothetical protein
MLSSDSVNVFAAFMRRFLQLPRKAASCNLLPLQFNNLSGYFFKRLKPLRHQQAPQVGFPHPLRVSAQLFARLLRVGALPFAVHRLVLFRVLGFRSFYGRVALIPVLPPSLFGGNKRTRFAPQLAPILRLAGAVVFGQRLHLTAPRACFRALVHRAQPLDVRPRS